MSPSALIQSISKLTDTNLDGAQLKPIGGGDINAAYRLAGPHGNWFVKVNQAALSDMFAAEAVGLSELAAQQCVRVPAVIAQGQTTTQAFLVLEFIELQGLRSNAPAALGRQLALLHRKPQAYFGWARDNTIGSTPQHNLRNDNWIDFWKQQRLGAQLQRAADNGYRGQLQTLGERLVEATTVFFRDYQPHASLLHGDLWGGNASADAAGQPVIYDPACYYGDRETDLAMTELFGGFDNHFYAAYNEEYPLDPGYSVRKNFYNLYHILNHLNLFGGGYGGQAQRMMQALLAEIGH